ncbi:DNA-binding protein RFX2-like isoform X3 [Anopheles albimanus]|uniref:DNA-binding protein RFX2-like isoform X3 n=1 Tax=Anopheles albimanus TaxID=7167 RepID=UPI001642246D|nr:DNA-binding protein RFX2-like isoform X3 [Anopheles albimanus]
MATRLAAQRSFINVIPTTVGTPNSSGGSIAGEDGGAVQASTSDGIEVTASGNSSGASELVSAVATITAAEPSSPVMTSRTSTTQLPAITIAGSLKNGSTKPASTVASATVLSNNNIFNLLSGTGLSLQQIVQKKIMIHPNGNVINIVPLNDESDATDVKVEKQMEASDSTESGNASEATADDAPQITAQVAVVQGQSPTDATPQYITVTVSSADNVPNHHTYVQYVDSDMYTTANQGQTQMSYPVYTVGDYGTNGQQQQQQQQYYTTSGNYSNTGTGSSGGAHSDTTTGTPGGSTNSGTGSANAPNGVNGSVSTGSGAPSSGTANQQPQQQQQYIVPVGESVLLGTGVNGSNGSNGSAQQSDSSPQNMTMNWLVENYETADGVSLPRSTLYNHYMWHCNENKLDAVNAASFGKLIRNVFSGLRTRRLGTRGNSKYHYYGIRIKPTSPLVNAMDCKPQHSGQLMGGHQQQLGNGHGCGGGSNHGGNMNAGNNGMNVHGGSVVGGNGAGNGLQSNGSMTGVGGTGGTHGGGGSGGGLAHHQGAAGGHNMSMGHGGRGHKKNSFKAEMPESCAQYLGDPSNAIPQFPIIDMIHPLADDITLEDVDTLRSIYREHCEAFLDAILNLDFNMIESLWREFWRAENNNNNGDECEEEKYLSKQKLYLLTQCEPVQEFVKDVDFKFYQNMVEVLIPDVLRPIPTGLTQAIRNFAKNLESWLTSAMSGCPEPIMAIKLSAVSAFGQTLRRYTSLNHLAQAARAVLQNGQQIAQMLNDLNRVDFRNVQEQASWICQCDTTIVQRLENDFKAALQQQNTLEEWAGWLQNVVDDALQDYRGKPSFVNAARQFLLKWSFYSSMVIRDLTLRSAGSFGSFHLIRLLYDEYMFFIIEHKVAKATNTTPIAVMGQQKVSPARPVQDELDSMLYNSEYGIVNVKLEPSAKRMRS